MVVGIECCFAGCRYAECYAECRYAECRHADCRGAIMAAIKRTDVTKENISDIILCWQNILIIDSKYWTERQFVANMMNL